MNTLDSRSLSTGDCYAQTFEEAGEFRYTLSPGAHALPLLDLDAKREAFLIKVGKKKGSGEPAQHTVHVEKRDGDLVPDADPLEIAAGDIVLWYTADPKILGFTIAGEGGKSDFGCHRLKGGAVYTHAFGSPGSFEWHDPAEKGVSGRVEVTQPDLGSPEKLKAWYASLEKPTTIEIRKGKASPVRVKISVGQTVFWKVWDGTGTAIRDKRLTGG